DAATESEIRRLYYAEHWKIGTIASQLGVHGDAVRRVLSRPSGPRAPSPPRRRITDAFVPLITETLQRYPRLRSTILYRMLRERGYTGSVVQLRRLVRTLRPRSGEVFLRLQSLPGEAAQVDWADFGAVDIGRARRRLSAFVLTLSYSRALYVEFFFDQTLANFLRGHVRAFESIGGVPRHLLTDNLRSVVLERRGEQIRFHPRYLELAGHYCFQPRPCHVARGNEKGRVERSIRYLRESFFAAYSITTLGALNESVRRWCEQVAAARRWPDDRGRTVAEVLAADEQPRLLALPLHPLDTSDRTTVRSEKTPWVRFDKNDYSMPPHTVGLDLTLVATDTEIRLLQGAQQVAWHRRCYDQGQRITDPAHTAAVLAQKRAALGSALGSPLRVAVPQAERFLEAAFPHHRSTAVLTTHLIRLLGLYGAGALNHALAEALQRDTPTLASVEFLLEKHRRAQQRRPPLPVDLEDRPELAALHVKPHDLNDYDRLSDSGPEQEDCDE
ncbi:MAG TPA: IS21 family transposase, partial [Thermoanaerobaculia bacterium]|nr:IS21 family transposase [Thermoanaerobaculia bacterium]